METYPSTNVLDIVRLLGSAIAKFLSSPHRFNFQEVLTNWLKGVTINYKSENVILNFLVKKVLLVSGRDLSAHILKGTPSSAGYLEGTLKKQGMSYLAPNALTISHDQQWQRLRPYNEKVLCTVLNTTINKLFCIRYSVVLLNQSPALRIFAKVWG